MLVKLWLREFLTSEQLPVLFLYIVMQIKIGTNNIPDNNIKYPATETKETDCEKLSDRFLINLWKDLKALKQIGVGALHTVT